MPRTILLVATTDLATDQRMLRIATTLALAGHRVRLMGRLLKTSPAMAAMPFLVTRVPCLFEKGPWFYLEYQLRVALAVLVGNEETVSAADVDTLPGAAFGTWLRGKTLFFDAHELFSEQEEVVARPRVQRVWQWLEKWLIPMVKTAYTVSDGVAQHYKQLTGVPFTTVRNLSIKNIFYDQYHDSILDKMTPFLLYVGSVNKNRGLEEVMASMPFHAFNLVVCGDGPDLPALKQMAAGCGDRVYFAGRVQPQHLPAYYHKAYMGLLLLQPAGLNYTYSLANKFFDYMLHGLPQLVSPLPEYLPYIAQWGFAKACWAHELADTLNTMDAVTYTKMQEAAHVAAQTLNWENEAQILLDLYAV